MFPGGFTPTDQPPTEHERHTRVPEELRDEARRRSAKSAWIGLAMIVLIVIAVIVLLSLMPNV